MDIQEKQAFESNFRTTEIYRRECVIRGRDILEFSKTMNGYFNIIANEAWRLWQAAKEHEANKLGQETLTHYRLQELIAIGVKAALDEREQK